jgi:hypothetical protein
MGPGTVLAMDRKILMIPVTEMGNHKIPFISNSLMRAIFLINLLRSDHGLGGKGLSLVPQRVLMPSHSRGLVFFLTG